MIIEIDSEQVIETTFNKDGKENTIRKQQGYWHKPGSKYPVGFEFTLGSEKPLIVGSYNVNPEFMLKLNRYESFEVDGYSMYKVISTAPYKAAEKTSK